MIHTLQSTLESCMDRLARVKIDNPRFEARLLICHVLNLETHILIGYPERKITDQEFEKIERLVSRRVLREPMSHILGEREFWSLTFKVTKDTLTPRPDSETLIESVLKCYPDHNAPLRVLDLGVGTGCLLLSVLHEYPCATGLGVDISEKALTVANENAQRLNLDTRADFRLGSWAEGIDEKFDLILSNPPYIPDGDRAGLEPEVKDYEPASALFAGADGLDDYRKLAKQFPDLMKPQGTCIVELGVHQADSVTKLMEMAKLQVVEQQKDLGGIIRCLIIQQ